MPRNSYKKYYHMNIVKLAKNYAQLLTTHLLCIQNIYVHMHMYVGHADVHN